MITRVPRELGRPCRLHRNAGRSPGLPTPGGSTAPCPGPSGTNEGRNDGIAKRRKRSAARGTSGRLGPPWGRAALGSRAALGPPWGRAALGSDLTRLHPIPGSQPRRAFQSCTNSERLHSGRGGVAESKIQPLLRDQCLAGQFGPLRQNVRAIPRAVLAWLAAHGFQPDLVCKSHWTAGKVGVRAHGAWGHEVLERHL